MKVNLAPATAEILCHLLADAEAISRAIESRSSGEGESIPLGELQESLDALADAPGQVVVDDDDDEASPYSTDPRHQPTDEDFLLDGAPRPIELRFARASRRRMPLQYARGSTPSNGPQLTAEEFRIALGMARRQPGLAFEKAVNMLRR